ncbi:MAG: universal stress protein [Desulfuromonadaceae bacterium]|nr:universal stress protein [Desulfuromonadaceae bacterium]
MGIKDILVHLDDSSAAERRVDLAILYARKHGAVLRGLYPIIHAYYESREIGEQSSLERIRTMFNEKTAAAGITAEWILLDSSVSGVTISDIVTMQAYYSDLVIVGQTNYRTPSLNIPTDFPEHLVKVCGRPVLVVPYAGSFETAGERIMVAWKTGRESVRSLNDAMPLVEKALNVSVVCVASEQIPSDNESQIIGVGNYLARHAVTVRTDCICTGDLSIGDTILNLACEHSADLLVMGAYAPTRRRTLELNPIAQHILSHLTVPVLLSH